MTANTFGTAVATPSTPELVPVKFNMSDPMSYARALMSVDIPVFSAEWFSVDDRDVQYPTGWERQGVAPVRLLEHIHKERHALLMQSGHGVDGIDVDKKHGADPDTHIVRMRECGVDVYGVIGTPSGGVHAQVISAGIGSLNGSESIGVDFRGRHRDGGGSGLLFLPGSTRPKYQNGGYHVIEEIDLARLVENRADPEYIAEQQAAQAAYLLGIGLRPTLITPPKSDTVKGEDVNWTWLCEAFPKLWQLFNAKDKGRKGSRSDTFHAIVCEVQRSGLTQGQALTIVERWRDHVAEHAPDPLYEGRLAEQLTVSWTKGLADQATEPERRAAWKAEQARATAHYVNSLPPTNSRTTPGLAAELFGPIPTSKDGASTVEITDQAIAALINPVSTWAPVDPTQYVTRTYTPMLPSVAMRTDGIGLFYAGLTHSLYGESACGKSLFAQHVAVEVMRAGERVLYLDFEDNPSAVFRRLAELGATDAQRLTMFDYVRPDTGLVAMSDWAAYERVLMGRYGLAIIDGVTQAMAITATDRGTPEETFSRYDHVLAKRIAERTGAAVVSVDHVTKASDSRGRHAIGSVHKLNVITGSAFMVVAKARPSIGGVGVIELRTTKDRPGGLDPFCSQLDSQGTRLAAVVTIESAGHGSPTAVTIDPPSAAYPTRQTDEERQAELFAQITKVLTNEGKAMSTKQLRDAVGGRGQAVTESLKAMVDDGLLERSTGHHGANFYALIPPQSPIPTA